jgi:hypothetical protein
MTARRTARRDLVVSAISKKPQPQKLGVQYLSKRPLSAASRPHRYHNSTSTVSSAVLNKFDTVSRDSSQTPRKLTETPDFSTPDSIRLFVQHRATDVTIHFAATQIQRTWRHFILRRRMSFFLEFIVDKQRRRLRFAMGLWRLAMSPIAPDAVRHFQAVWTYFFPQSASPKSAFLTFQEYMKTNIVWGNPDVIPRGALLRYCAVMSRDLLRRVFGAWEGLAAEGRILLHSERIVNELARRRFTFGSEFWCFHFWRRFKDYRRRGTLRFPGGYYLPEWSNFRAKELTAARLVRESDAQYLHTVGRRALGTIHANMVGSIARRAVIQQCRRFADHTRMLRGFLAFRAIYAFRKFNERIKHRILTHWYSVLDVEMMKRLKSRLATQRRHLVILQKHFRVWRRNALSESIKLAWLCDAATGRRGFIMPFCYLLLNDYVHFAFAQAFREWQKVVARRKKVRRFVTWSDRVARQQHLVRFVFDFFKTNGGIR